MASGEVDVKPGDQSVHEIVSTAVKRKWGGEGKVGGGAGVEIEGQNGGRVGDNGLDLDSVDKGLGKGGVFKRGVVETINVVPD